MTMQFMNPAGGNGTRAEVTAPATRLVSLRGVHVGLLDNGKTNADKFLRMVGDILVAEHGVGKITMYRKEALSKPAPTPVLDALASETDLGVTGIGDCGSCSTNCIHDGIEIEKRGTPCIAVATDAFVPGLDALTRMRGMPDYRYAVVPHPLGVLFDDDLLERAKLAVVQITGIALSGPGPI